MIAATFYLLLTLVPLILTPWNFELFEFNKMLTVYALTAVITGLWLIEMVRQKCWLFKPTPLDLPLILFFLSQVLATIFSIDPHTSVWGYYSRFHGGLLSTACYLILYWAYSTFMRDKTALAVKMILNAGLIVALYGIGEHFGIDKTIWVQDVQNRVFSTLGQPNWLAAYLIALIFIVIGTNKYWWSLPIFLITLYFTKSRSGWLGLGAGLLVYCLGRFRKLTLIFAVLAATAAAFGYKYLPQETGLAETAPAILQGGSSSSAIRQVVWQGAMDTWRHYPLIGSGVETFAYSYYNFRPAAHNLLSEWDFLYNKAHNEFINFLSTTGAFGLGSYLLLISWTGWWLIAQKRFDLLAGYTGIAVSNFFGFSVVPVALLFYLLPALSLNAAKPKPAVYHRLNNFQAFIITLILLLVFYALLFIAKMWRADFLYNLGRNQVKSKLVQEGWQNLARSTQLLPFEPVFRNDLAEAEALLAVGYASPAAEFSQQLIKQTIADADLVIAQNPVNLNFWRSRIKIFLTLATLDSGYYNQALEAFDQAMALAPTDPKLTYNLALVYNQLGQTGLAEQMLAKTVELKPNYEAARNSLGSLYDQTGRPDLAVEQYQYILEHLNPDNETVKDRLKSL